MQGLWIPWAQGHFSKHHELLANQRGALLRRIGPKKAPNTQWVPQGASRQSIKQVTSLGIKEKDMIQNLAKWFQLMFGGITCMLTHTCTLLNYGL